MKKVLYAAVFLSFFIAVVGLLPETSFAVPSFARQKGKACTDCHSIWPRLNAQGRAFKETMYTDVGENYPRIQEDNLDLLRFGPPLSISVVMLPYTKTTGGKAETRVPEEVALFFAGMITPNIGGFVEPKWDRDSHQVSVELAKLGAWTKIGPASNAGITLLKSDVAGADPYNTIRFTSYHTVNAPAIFFDNGVRAGGGDMFSFANTENQGAVAHAKLFNMLYLAAGAFRGDGSTRDVNTDPVDGFGRAAFEYAFTGEMVGAVGGFYYGGKQRYEHADLSGSSLVQYESKFNRYGFDLQYQYDSTPHTVDAVAVYMAGKDKNVWDGAGSFSDIKYKGFYGEISYFYDKKYGVTIGYDYLKSNEDSSIDKKGPTFNVTYSPWLNTKIGIEHSIFKLAGDTTSHTTSLLLHLYY